MTQVTPIEVEVEREECWAAQLVKQRYDLFVCHALPANVVADLMD